ncbi:hypothetical protein L227DRAFT_618088 [Lentinus tigrinus ALCF2SS1-6]|uniref:Uncharacterized protein n=1 Tax=Lentinus tigrinus ALCF2SS1-6 TaxID=1328759 RepID=A0A5C2RPH3_9APHY|nr:hypothetical protein L227DRAFT_618088 [Lentinus tigrinus ALCF2SS1-6]
MSAFDPHRLGGEPVRAWLDLQIQIARLRREIRTFSQGFSEHEHPDVFYVCMDMEEVLMRASQEVDMHLSYRAQFPAPDNPTFDCFMLGMEYEQQESTPDIPIDWEEEETFWAYESDPGTPDAPWVPEGGFDMSSPGEAAIAARNQRQMEPDPEEELAALLDLEAWLSEAQMHAPFGDLFPDEQAIPPPLPPSPSASTIIQEDRFARD